MAFPFPTPRNLSSATCFASYGTSIHRQSSQQILQSKLPPWSFFLRHQMVHRLDMVFAEEMLESVLQAMDLMQVPSYQKVFVSLSEILASEPGHSSFFSKYIKEGKVAMLSQGNIGKDDVIHMRSGQLFMFLGKESYERLGIVGRPHGPKGKGATKPRWIVEIDLADPSMGQGKRNFERLRYASAAVFGHSIPWVLYYSSSTIPKPDPLVDHSPITVWCEPQVRKSAPIHIPLFKPDPQSITDHSMFNELSADIYEWLAMVRLESPRIEVGDQIDQFLSMYRIPGWEDGGFSTGRVCKLSWKGLLAEEWVHGASASLNDAIPAESWCSFTMVSTSADSGGGVSETTILRLSGSPSEYMAWNTK